MLETTRSIQCWTQALTPKLVLAVLISFVLVRGYPSPVIICIIVCVWTASCSVHGYDCREDHAFREVQQGCCWRREFRACLPVLRCWGCFDWCARHLCTSYGSCAFFLCLSFRCEGFARRFAHPAWVWDPLFFIIVVEKHRRVRPRQRTCAEDWCVGSCSWLFVLPTHSLFLWSFRKHWNYNPLLQITAILKTEAYSFKIVFYPLNHPIFLQTKVGPQQFRWILGLAMNKNHKN